MHDSRFLNLHLLYTASYANQNRDESGMPKSLTYGGTNRNRWSSQAMTRPKRLGYENEAGGDQISYRAKGGMITQTLTYAHEHAEHTGAPLTEDETTQVRTQVDLAVSSLVINREKAVADKKKRASRTKKTAAETEPIDLDEESEESEHDKKATLVWLAEPELQNLASRAVAAVRQDAGTTDPSIDFLVPQRTAALAIAAYGRMFAARPDLQNEAAVQRGHAFTTHTAGDEIDYFTAVDDLPAAASGKGAGHLDFAQYASGVYYWHANLDRDQLWRTWIAPDNETARTRLELFFWHLLTALPTGKQNTTAPHTMPDAALAVPATSPISLHQAFEKPVAAGREGYRKPSLDALLDTHDRVRRFTPRQFPGPAHLATILDHTPDEKITTDTSLDDLISACVDWTLAGRPNPAEAR